MIRFLLLVAWAWICVAGCGGAAVDVDAGTDAAVDAGCNPGCYCPEPGHILCPARSP